MTTAHTPTAFSVLLTGLSAALVAALPGVQVHVNRTRPVAAGESRAVTLRLGNTRRDPQGPLGAADWQTIIEVECAARTPTGQDPAAEADAMLAAAWTALLGAPLGLPDVLDLDAEPEIAPDYDAADSQFVAFTFRLAVRHRTHANSLTPWST